MASLALGVGLNTAIFAELNQALRHPLPFPASDNLVVVGEVASRGPAPSGTTLAPSWEITDIDLDAWTSRAHALQSLAIYTQYFAVVAGHAPAEYIAGAPASADLLRVLGVQVVRGRWFTPEDAHAQVVVLSHSLWQRQFGGDERVMGQVLRIQGEPWIVIGVMPPGLNLPVDAEFWVPLGRTPVMGRVVGRLAPGATKDQVAVELQAISPTVDNNAAYGYAERIVVTSLHDYLFGTAAPPLALLFAGSVVLLLLTCANVAGLALARTLERQREMAVRMALGAGRARLTATVVAEPVLLALAGAAIGCLVGLWGVDLVTALAPQEITRLGHPRLDALTMTFAAGAAIVAALLISVGPVLSATDARVHRLLGHMGLPGALGPVKPAMRRSLVTIQIALAVVLIASAGLLIRSVARLTRAEHLGFSPEGVVIASVSTLSPVYQESRQAFLQALVDRVRAVPGVQAVAFGPPPLVGGSGEGLREGFNAIIGYRDSLAGGASVSIWVKEIDPAYFEVFRLRLREGRNFEATDDGVSSPVAILNAAAAKIFFPDRDPIGRVLSLPHFQRNGAMPPRVIGVVDDILQRDLTLAANPEILLPVAQQTGSLSNAFLAVRTHGDPATLATAIRQAMREVDPNVAPTRLETMQQVVDASLRRHAFLMRLLVAFAVVGGCLAIIGIYSVIAYLVTRRTAEMGIRMALGARPSDVVALVVGEGAVVTGLGVLSGTIAALVATRFLRAFLFQVTPHDATTFVSTAVGFVLVALVAAFLPARRAAATAPATALRE